MLATRGDKFEVYDWQTTTVQEVDVIDYFCGNGEGGGGGGEQKR